MLSIVGLLVLLPTLTTAASIVVVPSYNSGDAGLFYEGYYLQTVESYTQNVPEAGQQRQGSSTNQDSCNYVRNVPDYVRTELNLTEFYQKYTEAYGIPVLASNEVNDEAVKRACYTTRYVLADRKDIRDRYYSSNGRVVVIGRYEHVNTVPEHSHMDTWWNGRTRGLSATPKIPVTTAGEENLLCLSTDPFNGEDILLHQLSHGIHLLALDNTEFRSRLMAAFNHAKESGLWSGSYALTNDKEYLAQGLVTHVLNRAIDSNGTQFSLYDEPLYRIVKEILPCNNNYIQKCANKADTLQLKINYPACTSDGSGQTFPKPRNIPKSTCEDKNGHCEGWANIGGCKINPDYMLKNCKRSCGQCNSHKEFGSKTEYIKYPSSTTMTTPTPSIVSSTQHPTEVTRSTVAPSVDSTTQKILIPAAALQSTRPARRLDLHCTDSNKQCRIWSLLGECARNPSYMLKYCQKSCHICQSDEAEFLSKTEYVKPETTKSSTTQKSTDVTEATTTETTIVDDVYKTTETTTGPSKPKAERSACRDMNAKCEEWAKRGECKHQPNYMYKYCQLSCKQC